MQYCNADVIFSAANLQRLCAQFKREKTNFKIEFLEYQKQKTFQIYLLCKTPSALDYCID